jgi:hypothetical protein
MNIEATRITRQMVLAMIPPSPLSFSDREDLVFGLIVIHALQKKDSVYLMSPLFNESEFMALEHIMKAMGFGTTTHNYTDLMIYISTDPEFIASLKQ